MQSEKLCGTCKYHKKEGDSFLKACRNNRSEFYNDLTEADFSCPYWKKHHVTLKKLELPEGFTDEEPDPEEDEGIPFEDEDPIPCTKEDLPVNEGFRKCIEDVISHDKAGKAEKTALSA